MDAAGADVVSLSRSGSEPVKWAPGESWVGKVSWQTGDPTATDLSPVFSNAAAVISCVGVIGGSDEELARGNGDVNVAAASQVQIEHVINLILHVMVSQEEAHVLRDWAFTTMKHHPRPLPTWGRYVGALGAG